MTHSGYPFRWATTVKVPIGSLSDKDFLKILLKLPDWAAGLPIGGKVHSGPHYLEASEHPAEPLVEPNPDDLEVERAVESMSKIPRRRAPLNSLVGLPPETNRTMHQLLDDLRSRLSFGRSSVMAA